MKPDDIYYRPLHTLTQIFPIYMSVSFQSLW